MAMEKNKVKFGLNKVHYAKITSYDEEGVPTFAKPVRIPGAVSLSIDAEGEASNFYADDGVYYVINNNSGYTGDLEIALVPASALTINGLNTKMEYTVYTTRVSDTRIRLTIKITNNPGIANYSIAVKSDPAFKAKQHTQEDPRYSAPEDALISNYYYNEENHQSFLICVMGKTSSGVLENYIEYDIDKNDKGTHEFKIAFVDYSCPSESSNNYRYEPDEDFSSSDATVKVSQNEYVRLGDINCNNKVDTTDIFYLMQMVAEAKDNKISTVELDAELKNKNSSWYKNYSFLKCAAVADVTQDGWIKEDDKDELMLYVAQKGAGKDITNDKIDTLFPVTYVYNG